MPGAYARKSRKTGKLLHYVIWWKDENGKEQKEKGPRDKALAEQIARKKQIDADSRKAGLYDPREEKFAAEAKRTIDDAVEEYLSTAFASKGNTKKHGQETKAKIESVCEIAGFKTLGSIDKNGVARALAKFMDEGYAAGTINRYRAAIRSLTRWAYLSDKLRTDPLKDLASLNEEADRRRLRRTLSVEELSRLIQATHGGGNWFSLTGPVRALVYRLAVASGLRLNELRTLKIQDLDLNPASPALLATAKNAKNRKTSRQPLTEALAADLRAHIEGRPPNDRLFKWINKGAPMLRADLEAANLPYQDEKGEYFDFHSLRAELATLADAEGVAFSVIKTLMRHSTPMLTSRYVRPKDDAIRNAVSRLPIPAPAAEAEAPPENGRSEAPPRTGSAPSGHTEAKAGLSPHPPPPGIRPSNPKVVGSNPTGRTSHYSGSSPQYPLDSDTYDEPVDGLSGGHLPTLSGNVGHHPPRAGSAPDPDLERVAAAWPTLPQPIRKAILELVGLVK